MYIEREEATHVKSEICEEEEEEANERRHRAREKN